MSQVLIVPDRHSLKYSEDKDGCFSGAGFGLADDVVACDDFGEGFCLYWAGGGELEFVECLLQFLLEVEFFPGHGLLLGVGQAWGGH